MFDYYKIRILNIFNFTKKEGLILTLCCILGFILRLTIFNLFIKYHDHEINFYIHLAEKISKGLGISYLYDVVDVGLLKQPLYSLLISAFHFFISDWNVATLFVNIIFQSLLTVLLYLITKKIADENSGYIVCLIYNCDVYFLVPRHSYGIFVFFLCLVIVIILKDNASFTDSLFIAFFSLLLWLSRYEGILYIFFLLFYYLNKINGLKKKFFSAVIIIFTFLIFSLLINLMLNTKLSIFERLRYRLTFDYFPVTQHFLIHGWKSDKTYEIDNISSLYNSDPCKAFLLVIDKCLNKLPEIYTANLLDSIKEMYKMSLNIFLVFFASIGYYYIRKRYFILLTGFLPFIYSPFCSPCDNAQYTQFTALLLIILSCTGMFHASAAISKYILKNRILRHYEFFNIKNYDFIFYSAIAAIILLASISLFFKKFPVVIQYIHNESNYEYKAIFSQKRFKEWASKNIPPESRILAAEDIGNHMLFNEYRIFIAIKSSINAIAEYAKIRDIQYCLLDSTIIDSKDYENFRINIKSQNNNYSIIASYKSESQIFYLLKIK